MCIYTKQLESVTSNIHYMKRYLALIHHFLDNPVDDTTYSESHHILPRGLFPDFANDPNNIIVLPYKAHYIVHWLLAKGTCTRPMISAFNAMCNKNKHKRRITSTAYASAKRMFADSQQGELNHSYGMVSAWNKMTNTKVRLSKSEFYKNPKLYGGITCEEAIAWKVLNKGFIRKQQSQHQKIMASESSKGNAAARLVQTGESIGRVSKDDPRWLSGEIVSASLGIKKNITEPKVICPHCNKTGRKSNILRHHFDNCKLALML